MHKKKSAGSARIDMHKEDSKQKTIDEKDAQKQKSETLKHCKVFWCISLTIESRRQIEKCSMK